LCEGGLARARDDWAIGTDPLKIALSGAALIGVADHERGRILKANRPLAELLGSTLEDLTGASMCDYIHEDDRERAAHELARLIAGVIGWHDGDWQVVAADGRELRVRVQAALVSGGTGDGVIARASAL
jgi:PAS domain S-box-containing protein